MGREQGSGLVLRVGSVALRLIRDVPALLGHEEEGDELTLNYHLKIIL